MMSLATVDLVYSYRALETKTMRVTMMAVLFALAVGTAFNEKGTSHITHVGGFLAGTAVSLLFVPCFVSERTTAFVPWVSMGVVLLLLVVAPSVAYGTAKSSYPECTM